MVKTVFFKQITHKCSANMEVFCKKNRCTKFTGGEGADLDFARHFRGGVDSWQINNLTKKLNVIL